MSYGQRDFFRTLTARLQHPRKINKDERNTRNTIQEKNGQSKTYYKAIQKNIQQSINK